MSTLLLVSCIISITHTSQVACPREYAMDIEWCIYSCSNPENMYQGPLNAHGRQ